MEILNPCLYLYYLTMHYALRTTNCTTQSTCHESAPFIKQCLTCAHKQINYTLATPLEGGRHFKLIDGNLLPLFNIHHRLSLYRPLLWKEYFFNA